MTQPQQTIGNTVYHVGQVVTVDEMRDAPYGTQFEIEPPTAIYAPQFLKFRITALPNPDPVAEDWREVVTRRFMDVVYGAPAKSEMHALQFAMQEVCKADEVKLEWPDWSAEYNSNNYGALVEISKREEWRSYWTRDHQHMMITCFLLGGRVFVKGGV